MIFFSYWQEMLTSVSRGLLKRLCLNTCTEDEHAALAKSQEEKIDILSRECSEVRVTKIVNILGNKSFFRIKQLIQCCYFIECRRDSE